MTTVADILQYMQTVAPRSMREEWDKVGLNVGRMDAPVETVLVALDPFFHVCQEAKDIGAQLLITHHTLLFHPEFLNDTTPQGRSALLLAENRIAHINAHTNYDQAPGGVNDILAKTLGLSQIRVVAPRGTDENGREWGLLRSGTVDPQPLAEFLDTVREKLHCPGLRFADGGKPVHRVAVGGGSCCDFIAQAIAAGCDTFVTADAKYNDFWDARDLGLNLIDAGHFYTENPAVLHLAERLARKFPEITVKVSATHTDCAKFY